MSDGVRDYSDNLVTEPKSIICAPIHPMLIATTETFLKLAINDGFRKGMQGAIEESFSDLRQVSFTEVPLQHGYGSPGFGFIIKSKDMGTYQQEVTLVAEDIITSINKVLCDDGCLIQLDCRSKYIDITDEYIFICCFSFEPLAGVETAPSSSIE